MVYIQEQTSMDSSCSKLTGSLPLILPLNPADEQVNISSL